MQKMGLNAIAGIESKTAAVMDPFKLANDLLYHCHQKGMQIYDRTNINSIQHQKGKIIATTDSKHVITADHIIHCTGYESTETLKEKVVDVIDTSSGGLTLSQQIPLKPGYQVEFAAAIKREVDIKTGAVGLITEENQAEEILFENKGFVTFNPG